jgi:hypothetical protein
MKMMKFPFRWSRRFLAAGLCVLPGVVRALDIKVPATAGVTSAIQDAVELCPDNGVEECRILLQGSTYTLSNSLLIRNKRNITITGIALGSRPELIFQDDGTKAGPDSNPDSLALKPAGWKMWPNSCGTVVGGSLNTSNPFSTNGIQHNGVILIQGSHDITLDGLVIDGVKPIGWGKDAVLDCRYPVWYGNFGVNLYHSGQVTIRNSEIRNCFAGVYNYNRNQQGPAARSNAADLDKGPVVTNARYGEMGGHLLEGNLIHDNIWAAYLESNWDLGSTWRFNRVWNCHNTAATLATFTNDEAKNHTGGFMFLKDAVGVPERVYNNTFWQVSALFGNGGWRGNIHNYFYNNLVAEPWMNYTADSTGYLNSNFSTPYTNQNNMLWKNTQFMHANTFVPLKTKTNGVGRSWGDATRLQFQVQGGALTGDVKYLAGLQYQGMARGTIPQEWALEDFDYKSVAASRVSYTVSTANGPVVYQALDSAKVRAIVGGIPDGNGVMIPIKDTLGRIAAAGTTNILAKNNHYIRSLPFQSADPSLAGFLAPNWKELGVDSVVSNRSMQLNDLGQPVQAGGYAFRTQTGAVAARGAIQPDGRNSSVQLELDDRRPVVLAANALDLSFDLKAGSDLVGELKVLKACLYKDVDLSDVGATQNLGTCLDVSTAGFTPKLGSNRLVTLIGPDPGFNSRFELMIGGKDASGAPILANPGVWFLHKAESRFEVSFRRVKTDVAALDSVKVGELVWMRLRPYSTASLNISQETITDVTIHAADLQGANGAMIESSAPLLGRMQGDTSIQVRFLRSASAADVLVTGLGSTQTIFQGLGSAVLTPVTTSVKGQAMALRSLRRHGNRVVAQFAAGDLGKRWQLVRADGSLAFGGTVTDLTLELPRLRGAGWLKVGHSALPVSSF